MTSDPYQAHLEQAEEQFEALCHRCGKCCGAADGDPCIQLVKDPATGLYHCQDYECRLGKQKTVSGKTFTCVSIREHIKEGTLQGGCGYNKR